MQSMQSPYGGYWPSGDVSGYGAMSTGISTFGGGYGASDSGVRDTASTTSSININKANHNHSIHHYLASPGGSVAGPPSGQRAVGDQYGGARQHQQPQHQQLQHQQLQHQQLQHQQQEHQAAYDGRDYGGGVRSGSIVSMGGGAGFGSGGDPQRETELSVAMENLTLEEIDGNVFRMSKDQVSVLLQLKLDQGDPVFVSKICGEAQPYLSEMMKDPFGNYLFQKIADKVDEDGRTDLVNQVAGQMVEAGMNLHGTRSVQKIIEVCRGTPSQVAVVVSALKDATVPLCLDTNGNHVVQRLLQHLAPTDNAFVFEMLAEACVPVATHRHGCCVIQRAIDAATVEQSRLLVSQVSKHALQLMQDPYGNYVVQYVLGICSHDEAVALVNVPLGKVGNEKMVAMLSMQKFSSNVIEKCMDRASEEIIVKYVHELADPAAMRPLLQDQYANYVIQKTLQLAPRDAALTLVESIREHLVLMRNSSGGRRMLTRISKRFPSIVGVSPDR
ncbi:unnamed protein product [Ectocarpus sp. CCAP 1310/34]|nr:unnamed protein product [Ectocarpus sp. CCAP 1310/34]